MGRARDKGNRFEREQGKWLLDNDGECPVFGGMTSECARAGQLTNLGVDLISKHYAGECKHRKSIPVWLMEAWKQIVEKAEENGKQALLALKKDARKYPIIHCITEERHKQLLEYEKMYEIEQYAGREEE